MSDFDTANCMSHTFINRLSNSILMLLYTFSKRPILFSGNEVVIVKSGKRICGSGAALANAAILQNKCYFEMKIQSGGRFQLKILKELCPVSKSRLFTLRVFPLVSCE